MFDMRARVHIDITQAQFPGGKRGIVVYGPDDPMESYTIAGIGTFNEAMRYSYFALPMSEIPVGSTTLAAIAREARKTNQT